MRNFSIGLTYLICLVTLGSPYAAAQKITLQFLNGKNRKPLRHIKVYIYPSPSSAQSELAYYTDTDGKIVFESNGTNQFSVTPIGQIACGEQPIGSPQAKYSVAQVLSTGIVTSNDCGHASAEPIHGQLTYFATPATPWELFKN